MQNMMNDLEMMILSPADIQAITNRARRERSAAAHKFLRTAFAAFASKKTAKQQDKHDAFLVAAE